MTVSCQSSTRPESTRTNRRHTIDNPYAALREQAGYGHREFARDFKLNRKTLISIETGQYATLSERMINTLLEACNGANVPVKSFLEENYGVDSVSAAYARYQHETRLRFASEFMKRPSHRATIELSPFHFWVKDTVQSLQGLCKKLCLPPATVARYASGITVSMPIVIEDALKEIAYPYLQELKDKQEAWNG